LSERNLLMKQSVFNYLMRLRDTGAINMFGAAPYLQREFGMDRREARDAVLEFMGGDVEIEEGGEG